MAAVPGTHAFHLYLTSALAAAPDRDPVGLPGTPWSFRAAAGPAGRPAAEIYAGGRLVDVMVAPALAPRVLRGACTLAWAGQRCAVAWGLLAGQPWILGVLHPRPGTLRSASWPRSP